MRIGARLHVTAVRLSFGTSLLAVATAISLMQAELRRRRLAIRGCLTMRRKSVGSRVALPACNPVDRTIGRNSDFELRREFPDRSGPGNSPGKSQSHVDDGSRRR